MTRHLQDLSEAAKPAAQQRPETPARAATPQSPSPSSEDRRRTLQRLRSAAPVLQRVNGRIIGSAPVIQRMALLPELGEGYVSFGKDEQPRPTRMGALAGDNDWTYRLDAKYEDEPPYQDVLVYKRTPKGKGFQKPVVDPVAEALRKKLVEARKWQPELFDQGHGGAVEGTFEYVANYLFAEVPVKEKQRLWDQVWDVQPAGNDVVRTVKQQLTRRKRMFLEDLIALGLDASWKSSGVVDIAPIKVVKPDTAEIFRTGQLPPKPVGIGFHTTDGPPDKVVGSKAEGGWGGIMQTMTVPFFRARYALDAGWNPLNKFLVENGPTYRRGVEDNELLSTVSVATDSHATVRFPLWNPTRKGDHDQDNRSGEKSFKMEVWLYVVAVRDAYKTYARQTNPFGEIATGSIAPSDVIGWCKLTRWHDYENGDHNQVATADFYYELSALVRNPKYATGGLHDLAFAAAKESIEAERTRSQEKHVSAT